MNVCLSVCLSVTVPATSYRLSHGLQQKVVVYLEAMFSLFEDRIILYSYIVECEFLFSQTVYFVIVCSIVLKDITIVKNRLFTNIFKQG